CYSEDHLKKDCPKKKKKKSTGFVKKNVGQGSGSKGYDNGLLFDFKEFNDGLITVELQNGKAESGEASVGIQEKESLAQVWHKRLGHISEAGLHELEKREVLGNKGLCKLEFCKNCVLGKSTRVSFGPQQREL
ncbi:retrovirus-related pol polyprotein from transposon TNT 1-94, partial [Tanacetum coccineum]